MDTKKISFASAVAGAIAVEAGAARFYQSLAETAANPRAKKMLLELARSEREHEESLRKAGERLFAESPDAKADGLAGIVETAPYPPDPARMKIAEVIAMAIEAEKSAAFYYDTLKAAAKDEKLISLFNILGNAEREHEAKLLVIQKELAEQNK